VPILEVKDLVLEISGNRILHGINLTLEEGKTHGVVGESGCGKSMTGFAIMGMLPPGGQIVSGSIRLDGRELTTLHRREWPQIRGSQIALVMQDPFTSLNPMMRVGDQIAEAIWLHRKVSKSQAKKEAIELIDKVGVPSPETSARKYPHQMSGGQRQRIVIAIAFACRPKVLIADEPTTALDVTLQAQILRLLVDLQRDEGTAVMLISHDIGVIGAMAERISVFYAGGVVELGTAEQVLRSPSHPYTQALLDALPRVGQGELRSISGQPPDLSHLPPGCPFAPRCVSRFEMCENKPELIAMKDEHSAACWLQSMERGATPLTH
jgi:oligopeptide/dipeptide ABC transporter ATP-binding protein